MDKRECYVIYQIQIEKNTYETKEATFVLDIDESIEDQLRSRIPKIADWKWQIVGEKELRD